MVTVLLEKESSFSLSLEGDLDLKSLMFFMVSFFKFYSSLGEAVFFFVESIVNDIR
jgi:hypothetical protein